MRSKANIVHMEKCKDLSKEDKQYGLFSKALVHLMNEIDFFDKYVHDDNPFKEHFHSRFQEVVEKEEDCFALHEDIILFFREKSLRIGLEYLEDIEQQVLKEFEIRIHEKESLVAKWYFEQLPLRVYEDIANTIKNSKQAYIKWQNKK